MGLAGMVLSAISTVTGAIMYFAVTAQSKADVQNHGFSLSTLGVILMIAGAHWLHHLGVGICRVAPFAVDALADDEPRGR